MKGIGDLSEDDEAYVSSADLRRIGVRVRFPGFRHQHVLLLVEK